MEKNYDIIIQNFIDNPSNISQELIEILVKEDISKKKFIYEEENNYNFWKFLFLSVPHLEKFNEVLREYRTTNGNYRTINGKDRELLYNNIVFDLDKSEDIFDIIKNTSPYLFSIEQNYFIYSVVSNNIKQQSNLYKVDNFNAYVMDYWSTVIEEEDKIKIDSFYANNKNIDFNDNVKLNEFVSAFALSYEDINSAGRNIIYMFTKFIDFLASNKVSVDKKELIAYQLCEKIDCSKTDIINCITDFCSISYQHQEMYDSLLMLGYTYARIDYISKYVQNNKIVVEKEKLSALIKEGQTQQKLCKI